jgi:hypothetical protein
VPLRAGPEPAQAAFTDRALVDEIHLRLKAAMETP